MAAINSLNPSRVISLNAEYPVILEGGDDLPAAPLCAAGASVKLNAVRAP
jgi:hypothetical protein